MRGAATKCTRKQLSWPCFRVSGFRAKGRDHGSGSKVPNASGWVQAKGYDQGLVLREKIENTYMYKGLHCKHVTYIGVQYIHTYNIVAHILYDYCVHIQIYCFSTRSFQGHIGTKAHRYKYSKITRLASAVCAEFFFRWGQESENPSRTARAGQGHVEASVR